MLQHFFSLADHRTTVEGRSETLEFLLPSFLDWRDGVRKVESLFLPSYKQDTLWSFLSQGGSVALSPVVTCWDPSAAVVLLYYKPMMGHPLWDLIPRGRGMSCPKELLPISSPVGLRGSQLCLSRLACSKPKPVCLLPIPRLPGYGWRTVILQ